MIFKRGKIYWFNFVLDGQRHQKTTRSTNATDARNYESAYRRNLVNGEVGIKREEQKPIPTFLEFKETFMQWVRTEKPNQRTQQFYEACFDRLCEFRKLANAKLNDIDEPMVEAFKLSVKRVGMTTVNRYLATMRKALRYACQDLNLVTKVPRIKLYKKDSGAERECEYVFSPADYRTWLAVAREPLRSASVLAHDGGVCRGELLALQRDCVNVKDAPDEHGFWGTIAIRRGLKRKARRRDIPITADMAAVLLNLLAESKCEYVFTSLHDHSQSLSGNTLANQHRDVVATCSFHPDAGLHALRHTFLTECGRHTQNVRALQKLAGHSLISTTMRYIHPDAEDVLEIASAVQQARKLPCSNVTTIFTTVTQQNTEAVRKM